MIELNLGSSKLHDIKNNIIDTIAFGSKVDSATILGSVSGNRPL
jgi:hypothetical protein